LLATSYQNGLNGFQQDHVKAMELYAKAQWGLGYGRTDIGILECNLGNMEEWND
jgi:hypothetical protein